MTYNKENIEWLAKQVVETMDVDDLIEYAQNCLIEFYGKSKEDFDLDVKIYSDNE